MTAAPVLAHSCDNPLCQSPDHLRAVTNAQNKAQWAARHRRIGGVLRDMRGARGRSLAIREAIKSGADLAAIDAAGVCPVDAGQLPMSQPRLARWGLRPVQVSRPCALRSKRTA